MTWVSTSTGFSSIAKLPSVSDLTVFALFLPFGSGAFRDDCLSAFVPPFACSRIAIVASSVANVTFLGRPRFLTGSADMLHSSEWIRGGFTGAFVRRVRAKTDEAHHPCSGTSSPQGSFRKRTTITPLSSLCLVRPVGYELKKHIFARRPLNFMEISLLCAELWIKSFVIRHRGQDFRDPEDFG